MGGPNLILLILLILTYPNLSHLSRRRDKWLAPAAAAAPGGTGRSRAPVAVAAVGPWRRMAAREIERGGGVR